MATNTAASFTNLTGNGTAGPFNISFSYIEESEVDVTVDGVLKTLGTHYTFTSTSQITFTTGNEPANGAAIKFNRDTDISAKKVDFEDGSVLTENDLDTQNNQLLFGLQEINEQFSSFTNSVKVSLDNTVDSGSVTGAVERTLTDKLADIVNAADFGVKGDGVTDDSLSLQDAINFCITNGGKELQLNAGVYVITQTLSAVLDEKYEQLHIKGNGNVIFKCIPPSTLTGGILNVNITTNHYASNLLAPRFSIKNIEFAYANETDSNLCDGISLNGSNVTGRSTQMCVIESCQFVPWTNTTNSTLLDCFFAIAVKINDLHEVSFKNCSFYSEHDQTHVGTDNLQSGMGVGIYTTNITTLTGNYNFESCSFLFGFSGIYVGPYASSVRVANCLFQQNIYGIYFQSTSYTADTTFVSGNLTVTNSSFDNEIAMVEPSTATDTSVDNFNIYTQGSISIQISNSLFFSGRDLTSNPAGIRHRGCIYLKDSGQINIHGNNFSSKGTGSGGANIYNYANYKNTAIYIENPNYTSTGVDSQIQGNNFYHFASSYAAVYLGSTSSEIQCYEELNVFENCGNNIYNLGTNNITSLPSGGGGGATALNGLTDVTLSSVTNGQVLKYNGSAWVNGTDNSGSGATDLVNDTTPELGGHLQTNSYNIYIEDENELRLYEAISNGTNYTSLKGASSLTTSTTFTLPSADGTSGQFLQTDGSGVLSFTDVSGATDLSNTANGTSLTIESSTGNNTSLPAATTSAWGVMTDEDKTALDSAILDGDFTSNGFMKRTGAGSYTVDTNTYLTSIPSSYLQNVSEDSSPQLGANLDIQSYEITTSTTNGNIILNPNGTGVVEVKGDGTSSGTVGTIQLNCSNNNHGVKIASPPHSAGASYTLTLPNTDGNADQVLKTDGSGGLDWVDQPTNTDTTYSAGSGLTLTGTTFSVDTLNQNTTGSAATLTTPRAINGVNFDGSADITITDTTKMPLAGGTFTGTIIVEDAINENVFAITDAASVALDPDNGMVQTWTLGANRTATDSLTTGQSMLLIITASSSNYTLTWPTMKWNGGSAPTLGGANATAIELFKVGSQLYGATVGDLS